MNVAQPNLTPRVSADTIPRDYNFAADILKRNLEAGRAGKLASSIGARVGLMAIWQRASTASATCLRSLGIRREERILICLLDGIDWPTAFLGAIKAGHRAGAGQHAAHPGRLPLHAR